MGRIKTDIMRATVARVWAEGAKQKHVAHALGYKTSSPVCVAISELIRTMCPEYHTNQFGRNVKDMHDAGHHLYGDARIPVAKKAVRRWREKNPDKIKQFKSDYDALKRMIVFVEDAENPVREAHARQEGFQKQGKATRMEVTIIKADNGYTVLAANGSEGDLKVAISESDLCDIVMEWATNTK